MTEIGVLFSILLIFLVLFVKKILPISVIIWESKKYTDFSRKSREKLAIRIEDDC